MSLVNQMLRDLDDRDRKQKSKPGAWERNVRTTNSPVYDSRFLIVVGMLIVFLLGGAVKLWSAKEDAEKVYGVPAGVKFANSKVVLSLGLPAPVIDDEIKVDHKKIIASIIDVHQPTKSREIADAVTNKPESSNLITNVFEPIIETARLTAKKESTEEKCCKEDDCRKSPGFKGNKSDCQLRSPDKPTKKELSPSINAGARGVQRKLRPLTTRQQSQQFFQKGHDYFNRNKLDLAGSNLNRALQLDPENIQARLLVAQIYVKSEQITLAADILDQGLEGQAGNPQLAKQRAKLYLQQNDQEMALQTLMRALGNAGTDSQFYAFLAALYQRQQKHDHTIELFHRALSITPGVSKWWMGLAISLEASERFQQSLQAYRRALSDKTLPPKALVYIQQRIAKLAAHDYSMNDKAKERG